MTWKYCTALNSQQKCVCMRESFEVVKMLRSHDKCNKGTTNLQFTGDTYESRDEKLKHFSYSATMYANFLFMIQTLTCLAKI